MLITGRKLEPELSPLLVYAIINLNIAVSCHTISCLFYFKEPNRKLSGLLCLFYYSVNVSQPGSTEIKFDLKVYTTRHCFMFLFFASAWPARATADKHWKWDGLAAIKGDNSNNSSHWSFAVRVLSPCGQGHYRPRSFGSRWELQNLPLPRRIRLIFELGLTEPHLYN